MPAPSLIVMSEETFLQLRSLIELTMLTGIGIEADGDGATGRAVYQLGCEFNARINTIESLIKTGDAPIDSTTAPDRI